MAAPRFGCSPDPTEPTEFSFGGRDKIRCSLRRSLLERLNAYATSGSYVKVHLVADALGAWLDDRDGGIDAPFSRRITDYAAKAGLTKVSIVSEALDKYLAGRGA